MDIFSFYSYRAVHLNFKVSFLEVNKCMRTSMNKILIL